jgi:hypothetical protein
MLLVGFALILAVFTLPSALNLPLPNPSQTMEYAPVPGDRAAAAAGNFASLGLGSSASAPGPTVGGGFGGLEGLGAEQPAGQALPSQFQCVGSPPRQTEDPLSPPCVASFTGDNGCATYSIGVSCHEIRVLAYFDGGQVGPPCDPQVTPPGKYFDVDAPAQQDESCKVSFLRIWARYFNSRYQTYKRRVHFWVYFSNDVHPDGSLPPDSEFRPADAADNIAVVKPFAVLPFIGGGEDIYERAMAQKGVLNFTDAAFVDASVYQKFAGLAWGYSPSLEQQANSTASYMCQKVVQPGRVTFSGSYATGTPRKIALMKTTDAGAGTLRKFQDTVAAMMKDKCGFNPAVTVYYPVNNAVSYSSTTPSQNADFNTYAQTNMAQLSNANITTIVWPGGIEYKQTKAAANLKYYPEWVLAGDGENEGSQPAAQQDQTVWSHAIVVTPQTFVGGDGVPQACSDAWNSVHPGDDFVTRVNTCGLYYNILRQLYTGIQVAGPRLSAKTMDQGYHAIPPKRSISPAVPACYYDVNDYTCVKDGTAEWWDPSAFNSSGTPPNGCWRMMEEGARYLRGAWPPGDATAQKRDGNICNLYQGGIQYIRVGS